MNSKNQPLPTTLTSDSVFLGMERNKAEHMCSLCVCVLLRLGGSKWPSSLLRLSITGLGRGPGDPVVIGAPQTINGIPVGKSPFFPVLGFIHDKTGGQRLVPPSCLVRVCLLMCVHACGGQRSTSRVVLQEPYSLCFERVSHWDLGLLIRLG